MMHECDFGRRERDVWMCPAGTLRGRATNGTWASRANVRLGPSLQGAEKEASSLRYRGERVGTVARQPPIH